MQKQYPKAHTNTDTVAGKKSGFGAEAIHYLAESSDSDFTLMPELKQVYSDDHPVCRHKAHLMALKNVYQKWRYDRQDLEPRCLEQHKPGWV